MSSDLTVIALFCEHIREEKSGVFTLIGIIPDNVYIPEKPPLKNVKPEDTVRALPSLSIYIRINFDPDYDFPTAHTQVVGPDGSIYPIGEIEPKVIATAKSEAKAKGNILAGVVVRATLGNFGLPKLGTLRAEVIIGERTYIGGALNFMSRAETISSTEPPPPS